MLKNINLSEIKSKFGKFLSLSHNCFQSDDMINEKIVTSSYFSFMEKNIVECFLLKDNTELYQELFGEEVHALDNRLVSEYYWAGMAYITISVNLYIPLRQLFLLLPLRKMLSYFNLYHEMSSYQLIDKVKEEDLSNNLFVILKKRSNLSVKQISFLTGISVNTLNSYSRNNSYFYKTSDENKSLLKQLFMLDDDFLKETSSFDFYNVDFLSQDDFITVLKEKIINYLDVSNNIKVIIDQYASLPKQPINEDYLFLGSRFFYSIKNKKIFLSDKEENAILRLTLKEFKNKFDVIF